MMDKLKRCADIPFAYAPYSFEMEPGRHDLLFGDELEEGMIVLVSDPNLRRDPLDKIRAEKPGYYGPTWDAVDEYNLIKTSCWCRVTKLQRMGRVISFIGLYADGTKKVRTYHQTIGWFVQLEKGNKNDLYSVQQ